MESSTKIVRRLLDERGVEWSATVGANGTIWTHWDAFNGQRTHAMDNEDGTVEIFDQWNLTPEQAIAATLGWGMLTADDVRDLIERHSDASGGNGRDFHNGAYVAIADELNATLGQGTCHDLAETPDYRDKTEFKCSECGYEYSAVGGFGCDYGDEPDFRFCPNCGRRCVG